MTTPWPGGATRTSSGPRLVTPRAGRSDTIVSADTCSAWAAAGRWKAAGEEVRLTGRPAGCGGGLFRGVGGPSGESAGRTELDRRADGSGMRARAQGRSRSRSQTAGWQRGRAAGMARRVGAPPTSHLCLCLQPAFGSGPAGHVSARSQGVTSPDSGTNGAAAARRTQTPRLHKSATQGAQRRRRRRPGATAERGGLARPRRRAVIFLQPPAGPAGSLPPVMPR